MDILSSINWKVWNFEAHLEYVCPFFCNRDWSKRMSRNNNKNTTWDFELGQNSLPLSLQHYKFTVYNISPALKWSITQYNHFFTHKYRDKTHRSFKNESLHRWRGNSPKIDILVVNGWNINFKWTIPKAPKYIKHNLNGMVFKTDRTSQHYQHLSSKPMVLQGINIPDAPRMHLVIISAPPLTVFLFFTSY